MNKTSSLLLFASLSVAAFPVMARGPGAAGGSGSPHFGGPSPMSQAPSYANGRFAPDRVIGTDRAMDRMNSEGTMHERVTDEELRRERAQRNSSASTRAVPATPAVPGTRSAATPAIPATPAVPALR